MSESETLRTVSVDRLGTGRYVATNARGGRIEFGTGDETGFTPVELLLAAIGGCTSIDADVPRIVRLFAGNARIAARATNDDPSSRTRGIRNEIRSD